MFLLTISNSGRYLSGIIFLLSLSHFKVHRINDRNSIKASRFISMIRFLPRFPTCAGVGEGIRMNKHIKSNQIKIIEVIVHVAPHERIGERDALCIDIETIAL